MSKSERPPWGDAAPEPALRRPEHGHLGAGVGSAERRLEVVADVDPHPSWLKRWRSLQAGAGGQDAVMTRESARDLQDKIAHSPAETLAGLQAQAELISELAWNDVVAATARQLIAGLKRLQRPNSD